MKFVFIELLTQLKIEKREEIFFPLCIFWGSFVFSAQTKSPFLPIKEASDQKTFLARNLIFPRISPYPSAGRGAGAGAGVAWALSALILSKASLSAKFCSGSHCESVVYMHSGTEHGRRGIVDVLPRDVVVSGHAHSWVIVLILKSSVVINKLDKAISHSSYICKNDNYLKWREISIL